MLKKTIVLTTTLFGGVALGLTVGARWLEPSTLPAATALGLCLVGVLLILAAPPSSGREAMRETVPTNPLLRRLLTTPAGPIESIDLHAETTMAQAPQDAQRLG